MYVLSRWRPRMLLLTYVQISVPRDSGTCTRQACYYHYMYYPAQGLTTCALQMPDAVYRLDGRHRMVLRYLCAGAR